jgi:hypothetical protein
MGMAEGRSTITIKPDLGDYRGLLKALSQMDKESQGKLKNDVYSISSWVAGGIKTSAYVGARFPAQAAIVAATVRPARDRVPTIYVGGSKGRASGGANAGQLLFGNEFGGERNAKGSLSTFPNGGFKFPERTDREGRGNKGYWIFPTLKVMQPEIKKRWQEACVKVLDNWARNS